VVAKLGERADAETELDRTVTGSGTRVDSCVVAVNGYSVGQGLESLCRGPEVLVVTATPGHPHTRLWTGSVAEELVHVRPEGATVLVGPEVDVERFGLDGPIIGCVDPRRISDQLLRRTQGFAQEFGLEPRFATVIQPATEPPVDPTLRDVKLDVLRADHPTEAIVELADRLGASMLCAGTRQRDELSRLAFGSVAIDLVVRAHQPILAIHDHPPKR
jgi:nucleotide-binding universal stress UspA family protein